MPVKVYKRGEKYVVLEKGGKGSTKGRTHESEAKAKRQAAAINMALHKKGKI